MVRNPGVAFGLGAAAPAGLVLAVTAAAAVALAAAAWRGRFGAPASAGLVLGGAVANLADRAADGSVVDLVNLGWWPAFNLADVGITVGVGLLVLGGLRPTAQPALTRNREAA